MQVFLGMNLVLEKVTETFDEPELRQELRICAKNAHLPTLRPSSFV